MYKIVFFYKFTFTWKSNERKTVNFLQSSADIYSSMFQTVYNDTTFELSENPVLTSGNSDNLF